ncbi:hypothetical protein BDP27DRAFT_443246 [Rhodocollybia butyracea]|uniref:F-box domain-containing protein n=1 Tax=Rhodocollybia butyracea TaxID=206335 RepID=A0A9P5P9P4_9AGAR|nr:hypothetical protein BDP27DRAFT_443246 [Rhodocollybia butyracea]
MSPLQIRVNLGSTELSELERELRSEFGPSVVSSERAEELKEILALANKDIEDHDSELARLHGEIKMVEAEKQRLESQRAKLHSLLSPMRKLPNETLLRILQCVCENNLIQAYPWDSDRAPPTKFTSPVITSLPTMTISSVCSRWRALALASPSLWANLAVEIYTTTKDKSKALVGFIDTVNRYLARSGDWPLTLALTVLGSPCQPSIAEGVEFPSLVHLMQHARRWKSLKYRGDHSITRYKILSQLHFPLLAKLNIDDIEDGTIFSNNQIKILKIRRVPGSPKFSKALASYPSLKYLMLGYVRRIESASSLGTWPNITSISVASGASSSIIFSSNFPSLNLLVVEGASWGERIGDKPLEDDFISFVSRSSRITSLTLRSPILSDLNLIAALQVMPALLHLVIHEARVQYPNPITTHLISSLTRDQSVFLVPKLLSLSLISYQDTGNKPDDSIFVRMVESRWFKPDSELSAAMLTMGRASIQSVLLKFTWREVQAEVYKPLQNLRAEGLRVVIAGRNGVHV